ncbi:MAG TPA: hypothetical protein VFT45_25030 [Longimicrobium sp.]|nr:hypothetical protein [Longimicrobium sp.]
MTDFDSAESTPPRAQATYPCVRHGTQAGSLHLHRIEGRSEWLLVEEGFLGKTSRWLGAAAAERVARVLERADAAALYTLDLEYAPFYCPACDAVYCGECWRTFLVFADDLPGFLEETRGICPQGHERMLSD